MGEWNYDTKVTSEGRHWVSIEASGGRTFVDHDVYSQEEGWWYFGDQVYAWLEEGEPRPDHPAPLPKFGSAGP